MKNDYWVVFEFHTEKSNASKSLTQLKKKFSDAYIEADDSGYVITLGHCRSLNEANKLIHKAVKSGFWGALYEKKD